MNAFAAAFVEIVTARDRRQYPDLTPCGRRMPEQHRGAYAYRGTNASATRRLRSCTCRDGEVRDCLSD